jgi:uncharacterized phage protein (TIGR01671 family)
MREIEFRGKRRDTGEWVYGDLSISKVWSKNTTPEYGICFDKEDINGYLNREWEGVRKETVGQYTGKKDQNGVKIFEWDIVRLTSCMDETDFGEVYFDHGEWLIGFFGGDESGPLYYLQDCENGPTLEVIGNIHDNPELLEAGK